MTFFYQTTSFFYTLDNKSRKCTFMYVCRLKSEYWVQSDFGKFNQILNTKGIPKNKNIENHIRHL